MSDERTASLSELIADAEATAEEARAELGGLSSAQLNWQPRPDSWSVGQCLAHLATSNERYLPIVEPAARGELARPICGRVPGLPRLFGTLLINAVSPSAKRKLKAPKIFQPASSSVEATILDRFLDGKKSLVAAMRASADRDPDKIIMPSPVSPLITYSLLDAFRVLVAHDKRHLKQARRVMAADGFPT